MLKSIADLSPELQAFIQSLDHPLNQAQEQHVMRVADALVTTEGRKTLSALYRFITGDPCPKSAADTFRVAPWQADTLRIPLREKLVHDALAGRDMAQRKPIIFLSLALSKTLNADHKLTSGQVSSVLQAVFGSGRVVVSQSAA